MPGICPKKIKAEISLLPKSPRRGRFLIMPLRVPQQGLQNSIKTTPIKIDLPKPSQTASKAVSDQNEGTFEPNEIILQINIRLNPKKMKLRIMKMLLLLKFQQYHEI